MKRFSDPLEPLIAAGLSVRLVDGNRLGVTPATRLTDAHRQHIHENKAELLTLLAGDTLVWLAQSTWPNEEHCFADAERWALTDLEHATRFPDYASCLAHCMDRGIYQPVAIINNDGRGG